jgi:hypothetical protein
MTQEEIQKALELCKRLGIKVHKERKAKTTKQGKAYVQILERDGYKFITYDSRTQDKDICKRAKKACTLKAKLIREYYSKNW